MAGAQSTTERWVDLTERILLLRSIPVGAMLPPPVLKTIATCIRERNFAAGEVVMRQGEPIDALYLLTEGSLALTRSGQALGRLVAPQTLGFLGIIARSEGTYDATAEVDMKALELDNATLVELLEDHFSFLNATLRYAAERLYYEMQELPAEALSLSSIELPFPLPSRELDMVERILFLRTMSTFGNANLNALAVMSEQMRELRFAPGTRLWSEGDIADRSLFIVSGKVACETGDGRRFHYGSANVAGGVEALALKPRWYAATAETAVVALEGRADELIDLFEDNFTMAMDFIGVLATGLVALLERKAAMGVQPLAIKRNVSKLGAVPVGA
jgi:CRP-like cAMP-binding protein